MPVYGDFPIAGSSSIFHLVLGCKKAIPRSSSTIIELDEERPCGSAVDAKMCEMRLTNLTLTLDIGSRFNDSDFCERFAKWYGWYATDGEGKGKIRKDRYLYVKYLFSETKDNNTLQQLLQLSARCWRRRFRKLSQPSPSCISTNKRRTSAIVEHR